VYPSDRHIRLSVYSLSRREESSKHKLSDWLIDCMSALQWLVEE